MKREFQEMNNCHNCTHQIEPLRSCEWLEKQNKIIVPPCHWWKSKYIDSEFKTYDEYMKEYGVNSGK